MHVLLTGSAGYIGRNLARALRDAGHQVTGIDRVVDPISCVDEFIQADLIDAEKYRSHLSNIDYIFHLAAAKGDWGIRADEFYRDNVHATRVLIDVAREAGIQHWTFYSTVAVLGPSEIPLDEAAPPSPTIAYGASKAECEQMYEEYCRHNSRASVVVIRPSAVFGAGNPRNTNIYRLIDAIYRRRFVMIGGGVEMKTTSYIGNLVPATLFLFERQMSGGGAGVSLFHYVDAPVQRTEELVGQVYRALRRRRPKWYLPLKLVAWLARGADLAAELLRIDLPITSARIKKFGTATNFDAGKIRRLGFVQPVGNEEAIHRTVECYLQSRGSKELTEREKSA